MMEDFYGKGNLTADLTACDLEPIHVPGRIQPFGLLLAGPMALDAITYCSANCQDILGHPAQDILSQSFRDVLGDALTHDLRNAASQSTARSQRERLGAYLVNDRSVEVYVHVNTAQQALVELEPVEQADPNVPFAPLDEMRKFLAAASARNSIQELLDVSVVGLSVLTGFDRVMAYRYETNGDGEVVSEKTCGGHLESFLGLRYPAWDVPEQARALQVKNPLRMLTDVAQEPIPLLARTPDLPPLDMSLAHLRGISPVHVEYLENMGVGATLTIGLVVDGQLWGMFSCHHLSPRIIRSDVRIAVELYGQMISLVIKQKLDLEATRRRHRASEARERVLSQTNAKTDFLHAFPDLAPILADVVDCDGLAVLYEGKQLTFGSVPSADAVRAIGQFDEHKEDVILPVTNLSESRLINGEDLANTAGVLLIRATAAFPLQLLYFRDEKIRNLQWAGRPDKKMVAGPLGERISPRKSFAKYVESQTGVCTEWADADLSAAREVQIMLTQIAAKGERVQLMRHKDLVKHKRQQDLMIAELNHRVKNTLALIRSLSRQAKASSASLESYAIALERRIAALAGAHDLAVSNAMQGVSLRGILETELRPYMDADSAQILLAGPLTGLRADVAPMVALVLHEVVSNAAKYGALSTPEGVVKATWTIADGGLKFSWREIGGPSVSEPARHGFGRSLIEKAIPYELDGKVALLFKPAGVQFDFEIPSSNLVDVSSETETKLVGSVAKIAKVAEGKSALLVEDNVVLAMDMLDSLTRLGTESVETASSVEAGLRMAERLDLDFGVLDMNLRGEVSFGIASTLQDRGIPFLFVTGYGSSIDRPPALQDVPILTKPIDEGTLSRALEQLLVGSG